MKPFGQDFILIFISSNLRKLIRSSSHSSSFHCRSCNFRQWKTFFFYVQFQSYVLPLAPDTPVKLSIFWVQIQINLFYNWLPFGLYVFRVRFASLDDLVHTTNSRFTAWTWISFQLFFPNLQIDFQSTLASSNLVASRSNSGEAKTSSKT